MSFTNHFLCPKRQLIWATFSSFRPSYSEFSHALAQVSNLKGALVINLYEIPQPIREALRAPLTEVLHDVLYEAVSIFLLVRQQRQGINQISTKALRYCMRFVDLGLVNTFACLHNQEPVWLLPVIFFSTDCAPPIVAPFSSRNPPNVVFQWETVTTLAQLRHRSASLSSRWRNDASQVICASDFLHDVQLPCLILRHLLEGFLYSIKSPFRGFYCSSENAFVFFQSPLLRATKPRFIILCVQPVSSQHLTCSKYSLAGDSSCH